jgi:K+-transporting ATPase ATPase A chain
VRALRFLRGRPVGLATCVVAVAEQHGSPVLRASGVNITSGQAQSGGNMTDKEVRFGIVNTALFATATTASSDGAGNGGLEAFIPVGEQCHSRTCSSAR